MLQAAECAWEFGNDVLWATLKHDLPKHSIQFPQDLDTDTCMTV